MIVLWLGRGFLFVRSYLEFGHVVGLRLGRELQPWPGRLVLGLGLDVGLGFGVGPGFGVGLGLGSGLVSRP